MHMKFNSARALGWLLFALAGLSTTALAAGPAANAGRTAKAPITLSLIALNDFHGNILPPTGTVLVPDPANTSGIRVTAGGAAYLATLVKNLTRLNPKNTLLVATGDLIGASPLTSGFFHDEPTIDVLGQIGLAVSSVGNHELDKGRAELLRMQEGGCFPRSMDGTAGVVGVDTCMNHGKFAGARFQYLAANIIDKASGETMFPSYAIRLLGGVKVGFIGLTLKNTPSVVIPAGVVGLKFADEVETINRLVPLLKAKGVTVFVLLLHQGGATKAKTLLDKSCPGFSGAIIDLADRMDPAIDVILSAHTHQEYVCFRPDGKLITQAGSYGRLLTKIDLIVDQKTKRVIAKDANNQVVVNDVGVRDAAGKPIPLPSGYTALRPDSAVERVVRRYRDLSAPLTDMVVGRISGPLDRKTNQAGESTLGAVIADALLAGTSDSSYGARPSQIAFINRGGLRGDLNSSLDVTFGNLFNVLPFNDNLVSMDVTGQQLLRFLEQQWESPQPAGGRVMSVSAGFSYAWDANMPEREPPGAGRRVVPGSMKLSDVPIEMDGVYRVTVNNFMATSGDNFSVLKHGSNKQMGEIDMVVAKQYFKAIGVVNAPALNRISRLN
jgi:5'-nucleotidase